MIGTEHKPQELAYKSTSDWCLTSESMPGEENSLFNKIVLGKFDLCVQEYEIVLPYMLCKNQLVIDIGPKYMTWYLIEENPWGDSVRHCHRHTFPEKDPGSTGKKNKNG